MPNDGIMEWFDNMQLVIITRPTTISILAKFASSFSPAIVAYPESGAQHIIVPSRLHTTRSFEGRFDVIARHKSEIEPRNFKAIHEPYLQAAQYKFSFGVLTSIFAT